MSWEHICEVCGKSVFLANDMRGCQILCLDCEELQKEADRSQDARIDRAIEVDAFPNK